MLVSLYAGGLHSGELLTIGRPAVGAHCGCNLEGDGRFRAVAWSGARPQDVPLALHIRRGSPTMKFVQASILSFFQKTANASIALLANVI